MWFILFAFFLIVIILLWIFYLQPWVGHKIYIKERCQTAQYLPYPETSFERSDERKERQKFLFILDANVYFSNCHNLGPIPIPKGFTAKKITSSVGGYNDMYGYVFENSNTIIISFTGTYHYYQWGLDLETNLVPFSVMSESKDVKVHQGFKKIFEGMKDQINNIKVGNKKLYISGISLGGALSLLTALDLYKYNPKVYAFAAPRVFNIAGAKLVDEMVPNILRICNTEDMIPTLPISCGEQQNYMHVGKCQTFTINLGSSIKNHTDAYALYFDS
jgi:hypothetical protein